MVEWRLKRAGSLQGPQLLLETGGLAISPDMPQRPSTINHQPSTLNSQLSTLLAIATSVASCVSLIVLDFP
jgi:hypothetical protein